MDRDQIDQFEEAAIEAESVLGVLQLVEAAVLGGMLEPSEAITREGLAAALWAAKRSQRRVAGALEVAAGEALKAAARAAA